MKIFIWQFYRCNVLPSVFVIEGSNEDFYVYREILDKMGYVFDVQSYCNYFFVKKDMLPLFNLRCSNSLYKK
jgi:hypothetical protein